MAPENATVPTLHGALYARDTDLDGSIIRQRLVRAHFASDWRDFATLEDEPGARSQYDRRFHDAGRLQRGLTQTLVSEGSRRSRLQHLQLSSGASRGGYGGSCL